MRLEIDCALREGHRGSDAGERQWDAHGGQDDGGGGVVDLEGVVADGKLGEVGEAEEGTGHAARGLQENEDDNGTSELAQQGLHMGRFRLL